LEKDPEYGDIVMICTDGIYSSDQVNIGRTKDGSTWFKIEQPLLRFVAALDSFFAGSSVLTDDTLRRALDGYLAQLHADDLLDDDASLGVIVTAPALRYQAHRRKRRS
jgi:hypothetical protein